MSVSTRQRLPTDRFLRARLVRIDGLNRIPQEADESRLRFLFLVTEPPFVVRLTVAVTPARVEPGNRLQVLLRQMGVNRLPENSVPVKALVGREFQVRVGPPRHEGEHGEDGSDHQATKRASRGMESNA